jgi:hypothetical protein
MFEKQKVGQTVENNESMRIDSQTLETMQVSLTLRQRNSFTRKTNTEADKPTSFFLGWGKKSQSRTSIHKIKT